MRSLLDIPLYKRSDDTLKQMCKKGGNGVLGGGIYVDGKANFYRLYDTGTGETKYTWNKGKSRLSFREWYSKYCPKASEDYTLFLLVNDTIRNPIFHITLALAWLGVSSYINYYKSTNKVSEDEENKLAAGLIVSSIVLHFFFYRFFSPNIVHIVGYLRYANFNIFFLFFDLLPILLLLINPITLPSIIIALNLFNVKKRDDYKDYLWKINTGFCVTYFVVGLLMGYVVFW